MSTVYVVGTCDTKGAELVFVRDLIAEAGVATTLVDVSTHDHGDLGDVTPTEVRAAGEAGATDETTDRGEAVTAMSLALVAYVEAHADEISGIIGIGGSGGTALITPAMRALPVGVPKVMVSTVASGDVSAYVGPTDISMTYSVTDVAGLNRISRVVLGNAAHAMAGMVSSPVAATDDDKPAVGLTMFGVTTPLVTALVDALSEEWEPLVFHATGTGGQSMEKLVESGQITALLDSTTTEIADHVGGGLFSAGPGRLDVVASTGIPYVGSVGACDMVNFGARRTVPEKYAGRLLHVHNDQVTLMRTTAQECRAIGEFIADKLNACEGPVRFLLPTRGVSMLDAQGQAFWDPDADEALFDAIESGVHQSDTRRVVRVDANVNDTAFATALLEAFAEVTR